MSSRLADSLELCRDSRIPPKKMGGDDEPETTLDDIVSELPAKTERTAAHRREVDRAIAADYLQDTDRFQQQIAAVVDQLTLVQRDQAAQMAELQSAQEQNAAIANELAGQKGETKHWRELAQQKVAEIEGMAAYQRDVEQTIAAVVDQLTLVQRDQAAQTTELQAAREQNAAMAAELAEQKCQTQHWQETAQQKLTEIEDVVARQREVEQATAASHRQETDQLRQQIAELAEQRALAEGREAAQTAELQAARGQNATMAAVLSEQKRQTQHWQETAQQKTAEIEAIAAHQREVEQATDANHRQETDQLRQQIAALVDEQVIVKRELAVPPAELQAAREQNAAMAAELAEQTCQTQHWQETAQQKTAEIEAMAAHQREVEQATAASHRQQTDQLRQQIAELTEQRALAEGREAAQTAELQAAREQIAAMAAELAEQKRQTQRWQETAQQKLAEIEAVAARQRDVEQATAAGHQQETNQLRQQIAELAEQQVLAEGQQAAQTAGLQAAREQNSAMAAELVEQKCQTQRWQEFAQQKLAEIEGMAEGRQEVEQKAAADHRQEIDHFRQQIADLIEQQALAKREQAIRAAEVQAAREHNTAMEAELADQKLQAQRWKEMVECAKQVSDLHTLFEHRQACQKANEEAGVRAPSSADAGGRLDRREDASMLQPAHSDQVAQQAPQASEASNCPANGRAARKSSEESSEQDRLTAKHQAQWEELLRTRSSARK
ncbi:MAG: hypothetical protein WCB27_17715 [Thermoguttaceae bacterium]